MTNIAKTLRDQAAELAHWADEFRRGQEPDIEIIRTVKRRIEMQAEMLEEGLHE